jgi:hypothetical protein
MGCDIHAYYETKEKDTWEQSSGELNIHRSYTLFGLLANVRRPVEDHFEPRGFPEDASLDVLAEFERWDVDAHTPSYLTLEELKYKRAELLIMPGETPLYLVGALTRLIAFFDQEDLPDDNQRIVFWFDN